MNTVNLTGVLTSNATVYEMKGLIYLRFILETRYPNFGDCDSQMTSYIPCVVPNPTKKEMQHLFKKGKGKYIEINGTLHGHMHQIDGQPHYMIEVFGDPTSMFVGVLKR